MLAFCPLCASDERTTEGVADDGRKYAVCMARDHGDDGFVWEPTPERRSTSRGDGLGADLDIWDKLLGCVPADGMPHSYGDVEDEFLEKYPREAGLLQERYGHRWREGKRSTSSFSMSVYLAARLSELADEKLLAKTFGPAEGPWSYNGVISHWARG